MVQNNRKSRHENRATGLQGYRATGLRSHLFARFAHSFACSALFASFMRSAALIHSLARSLTPELVGMRLLSLRTRQFRSVLTHCSSPFFLSTASSISRTLPLPRPWHWFSNCLSPTSSHLSPSLFHLRDLFLLRSLILSLSHSVLSRFRRLSKIYSSRIQGGKLHQKK